MKDLTVIIPTSPIPSHPSTAILDETIANIRKYTDAPIEILFDGVHEKMKHRENDYKAYYKAVVRKIGNGDYGDCGALFFQVHTHQAGMTEEILTMIDTPLIMFCEHDTSPIGDIPFQDMCKWLAVDPEINYIRFNIFDRILEEHEYLMLDEMYGIIDKRPFTLRRTIQWSQRPHIAKSEWYRRILRDHFGTKHKNSMIEDVMHSVVIESHKSLGKDVFGLAIYTPEGNQLRSYHSDGRGQDEKITVG